MAYTGININDLHQYVEKIASQVVDLNGSNTVVMGTIEESLAGYYNVKLTNSDTTSMVKAITLGSGSYKVDDYVYLIKAENEGGGTETRYFIFGLVSDVEEEFVNLTDWERFQASADGFSGTASTYYYNDGTQEQILNQTNNSVFLDAIKNKGAFSISGIFNCPASVGEQLDDYGIKVELVDKEGLVDIYYLNTHYFSGQPFNTLESFQKRIIKLDKVVDLSEVKVSLWSDPGYTSISDDSNVFWVEDLQISAGALMELSNTLSSKIEAENGKNYFYKTNPKADVVDSITLTATAYADKQVLSASSIQYYWLIKDDNIKEDDKQYLSFAGKGWRCINEYHEVDAIGVTGKIQVWDNKKNSISFDKGNDNYEEYFSNYLTQLKCAIKYQNVVAISDEFEILNYNKESFYATVESNVEPKLLILSTDKVELTCQVDDRNDLTDKNDYDFKYQWQKKVDGDVYQSLGKNTTAILTVKDDGKNTTEGQYEMAKGEEVASFRCVVEVYKKGSEDLVTTIYSESIEVTSKVAVAAQLSQPTYYKYFIDTDLYLTFQKEEDDKNNNWTGDWLVYKKTADETEESGWKWNKYSVDWTTLSEIDNAAFDVLNKKKINDNECLYYTYQKVWKEIKEGEDPKVLKTENWAEPTRLKIKVGSVEISPQAVAKMNTFNNLTQGGELQGLQTAPDGDVYLNATYINTGTLIVSDTSADREPVFMADIDTGEVKIAGFTVDENSIDSITEKKKVHLGTDGLNIGDKLVAVYDKDDNIQVSVTGSITIMDGDEEKELTEVINTIRSRQLQIVYSSSLTKPNKPTYATIGKDRLWHTSLTDEDIWMCQKVDITLEDSDISWGEVIQIKGLSVEGVTEYYAISKSNTTAPNKNNHISTGIEGWRDTLINPNKEYSYLWNYEVSYYDESKTLKAFESDPILIAYYTENGRGIVSIVNKYVVNNSQELPGNWKDWNWQDTPDNTTETNKYLWNYEIVTYDKVDENNKLTKETTPAIIGTHGETGAGMKKINTYSRSFTLEKWKEYGEENRLETWTTGSSYNNNHIKVGDTAYLTGTVSNLIAGQSGNVSAALYGVVTEVTIEHVKMTTSYLILGGEQGAAGSSITRIEEWYLASGSDNITEAPEYPKEAGWSNSPSNQTLALENKYLWNFEIAYNDQGKPTNITAPAIIGYYTEDGRGIVSITNYYQTTSSSTAPARWEGDTNKVDISTDEPKIIETLWKTSADPTTNEDKYLWNFEKIEYSKSSRYTYTAPIQVGAHGNPGTPGGEGPAGNGIESQTEYYKASSNSNAPSIANITNGTKTPENDGWYTKENFFKTDDNNSGPWDTKEEVSANPYVWKIIYTAYTNKTKTVTDPILLSDLDAATNAAAAQGITVGQWCLNMERTIIDGSTIATGSVTANQIDTTNLKSEYILVKDGDEILFEVDGRASSGPKVYAKELSTLSANMGEITAGTIHSEDYTTDENGNYSTGAIISFDDNNPYIKFPKFSVDKNGILDATNGIFQGTITATDGKIGGFNIQGTELIGLDKNIYLGSNKITIGDTADTALEMSAVVSDNSKYVLFRSSIGKTRFECGETSDNDSLAYFELTNEGFSSKLHTITIQARRFRSNSNGQTYDWNYMYYASINPIRPYETRIPVIFYVKEGGFIGSGALIQKEHTFSIPANSSTSKYYYDNDLNEPYSVLANNSLYVSLDGGKSFSTTYNLDDGTTFPLNGLVNLHSIQQTLLTGEPIGTILFHTNLIPDTTATQKFDLGGDDKEWQNLYLSGSVYNASGEAILSSDENQKNTITQLSSKYSEIFDKLIPVTYKYNIGTSDRLHTGFIAQDVKKAIEDTGLTTKDFACYCEWEKSNGEIVCGLRYTELISLCVKEIQQNKKKIESLENRIEKLEKLLYNN